MNYYINFYIECVGQAACRSASHEDCLQQCLTGRLPAAVPHRKTACSRASQEDCLQQSLTGASQEPLGSLHRSLWEAFPGASGEPAAKH